MSSVEWSPARGTSEADGQRRWPLLLEEREEALTQLGGRAHPGILRAVSQAAGRGYAAGGGSLRRRLAGVAKLLVELALAPRGRVLRDTHRLARIASRRGTRTKPCDTPAAKPLTFFTGVVIAVETARTAVSALSAIETALSVTVSSLSSWSFTRSTVPPALTITGSSVALGALDERRQPRERAAHADEHVQRARAPLATKNAARA